MYNWGMQCGCNEVEVTKLSAKDCRIQMRIVIPATHKDTRNSILVNTAAQSTGYIGTLSQLDAPPLLSWVMQHHHLLLMLYPHQPLNTDIDIMTLSVLRLTHAHNDNTCSSCVYSSHVHSPTVLIPSLADIIGPIVELQ